MLSVITYHLLLISNLWNCWFNVIYAQIIKSAFDFLIVLLQQFNKLIWIIRKQSNGIIEGCIKLFIINGSCSFCWGSLMNSADSTEPLWLRENELDAWLLSQFNSNCSISAFSFIRCSFSTLSWLLFDNNNSFYKLLL